MVGNYFLKSLLAGGLLLAFSTVTADDFLQRLDQAVVAGSPEALAALQTELGEPSNSSQPDDVYLWAYTSWRLAQRLPERDRKVRKRLLKDVQEQLEALIERQPGDAEALALLGSVLGDRIDGAFSGMRLGGRASEVLERASELAPQNPRVALQRGVGYYFTPKPFGGGLGKAEQALRQALDMFAAETADQPWPNWGRLDTLARLGQVLADQDRSEEARAFYQQALEQAPDFVWVRDELLPALSGPES